LRDWDGGLCRRTPLGAATAGFGGELKDHRNAAANQIRGPVSEYGLVAPQALLALRRTIPGWLEDAENGQTDHFRTLLHGLWGDLLTLDERIKELDKEIERLANGNEVTRRLQQLRGVGPMVAIELVATVGTGEQYRKGHQMAAALCLTPRQNSSGDKHRMFGISKRGDAYLRTLLIHLWPDMNVCQLQRPDIRAYSYLICLQQNACNEEESIYGHKSR
jgi:transposase